jgi:phosphatidylserine/phosphatidylglycerophosphate/cardiolipin synthase-like enzyme
VYVTSSDPRLENPIVDTNSGTISRLIQDGNGWKREDLVRGLPRSRYDHAPNGLQLDPERSILYVAQGGNTNAGAPATLMGRLPEYALSGAVLAIDLTRLSELPYDLPTLDDEDRPGNPDENDPFGGNSGKNQAILVPGGRGNDTPSEIYSTYLEQIGGARRYVWITQGYFVPDEALLEALARAAERGVDVRIIAPSVSDVTLILHASRHLYGSLLQSGVHIFEYQDAVLHAKTAVIDGYWSTVGSSNLDYLSFMRNHEVNAVITGEAFADRMERTFLTDLGRSREVSLEDWRHRPLADRLAGHVACHFQNWF